MYARVLALVVLAGVAQAQDSLFISGNVNTGVTWHAPTNAGSGTSGSCSLTSGPVQFFDRGFFTDQTASTYSLHLYYESFQSGFVYLYRDAFNPLDPCAGEFVFGYAPIANITNIQLDANRQYFFATSEDTLYGGGGSFQVTIDGPAGSRLFLGSPSQRPYCFGDGSGTACPCGNASPASAGAGCRSSIGLGGQLRSSGTASLASDTLVLFGTQIPNVLALYFQGTSQVAGGTGAVFGDGLRCAGGSVIRLATKISNARASQFPESGDPSISSRGRVSGPGMRTYQIWVRDAAAFCTPSPFNLTNALIVDWTP